MGHLTCHYEGLVNVSDGMTQDYKCKAHTGLIEINCLGQRVAYSNRSFEKWRHCWQTPRHEFTEKTTK
jgi:hypothetical protein